MTLKCFNLLADSPAAKVKRDAKRAPTAKPKSECKNKASLKCWKFRQLHRQRSAAIGGRESIRERPVDKRMRSWAA